MLGGDGGPAVRASASFLFLSNCSLDGGLGGEACNSDPDFGISQSGTGGPGILFEGASSQIDSLDSSIEGATWVQASCSFSWDGPGGPMTEGAGTFQVLPGSSRSLSIDDSTLAVTGSLVATVEGTPGDSVHLVIDGTPGFTYSAPLSGVWTVPVPSSLPGAFGMIPPSGTLVIPVPLTALGGAVARTDWMQLVAVSTGGVQILGTPRSVVLVDSAPPPHYSPFCFGSACPCGNDDPGAGCVNGLGSGAFMAASGSTSVALDDLVLTTDQLPLNEFGLTFMSQGQGQVPFGNGLRCAVGMTYRFNPPQSSGPTGTMQFGPSIVLDSCTNLTTGGCITAASTWHFQSWYRDPAGPCGGGFNTSNAMAVTFTL